ncbi:MAG TPA: DUF4340 domain-containing protein [Burkholderiales bacterium]|nr:DUF4340 domain-containing protein [Burkholderiales bacterium]
MKPRLILNLVLFAAVVVLGAFAWLGGRQPAAATYPVSALDPATVASVRIERPGEPPVALERRGGAWRMTSPLSARAEPIQVRRLLGFLAATSDQRLPARDLERFELDRPVARITADGETFSFGSMNPIAGGQYVQAADWVYLVDSRRTAEALVPASRLLSPRLLAEEELPVGFELGEVSLRQTDGKWLLEPAPGTQVSQDDLNRWVQEWRLALAQRVAPLGAGAKPLSTLRVRLAGGTAVAIEVLAREPETVLARPDEKLEYRFPKVVGDRLLTPPKE